MAIINYFNGTLTRYLTHQFDRSIYVAVSEQLHVSSTRCNHCQTCHTMPSNNFI